MTDPVTPRTEAGRAFVADTEHGDWRTPILRALAAAIRTRVLRVESQAHALGRAEALEEARRAVEGLPGMNGRHDEIGGALEVRRADVLAALSETATPEAATAVVEEKE